MSLREDVSEIVRFLNESMVVLNDTVENSKRYFFYEFAHDDNLIESLKKAMADIKAHINIVIDALKEKEDNESFWGVLHDIGLSRNHLQFKMKIFNGLRNLFGKHCNGWNLVRLLGAIKLL